LIEINPTYVDRIIKRWEEYAKDEAILSQTQQTFAEVKAGRNNQSREDQP
jgi:DNA modification methylase